MNTILDTILILSLSGTVLMLALLAVKWLFRKQLSQTFLYYLWLVVLLRLVLPLPSPVRLQSAAQPVVPPAMTDVTLPYMEVTPGAQTPTHIPGTGTPAPPVTAPMPPQAAPQGTAAPRFDPIRFLTKNLGWLWLTGAVLSLGWFSGSYFWFSDQVRRSLTQPSRSALCLWKQLNPGCRPKLFFSRAVSTPMLLGLLRPVVVLPDRAFSQDSLTAMLSHELCHYRRRDILYKWAVVLVSSLHWFNPFMLLLRREIGRSCELSCDETIIRFMDAAQKQNYGHTLLALAAKQKRPAGYFVTTLCHSKGELKTRLLHIARYRRKSAWTAAVMLVLALSLTACGAVLGPKSEAEPPKAPPVPTEDVQEAVPEAPPEEVSAPEEVPPHKDGYLPLEELLEKTRLFYAFEANKLSLVEDSFQIDLFVDDKMIYRNGYITDSMKKPLAVEDGVVFLPEDFYEDFLLNGHDTPSLYNGIRFFPTEVVEALDEPEVYAKVLEQVELPRSMDIETPNLDQKRIFNTSDLEGYTMLLEQLRADGWENPEDLTYGEYQAIWDSQTLDEAGYDEKMYGYKDFLKAYPHTDPSTETVKAFSAWMSERTVQGQLEGISPENMAFLVEKNIRPEDVHWLQKDFYDSYPQQPDETLKEFIEAYYQMGVDQVRSQAENAYDPGKEAGGVIDPENRMIGFSENDEFPDWAPDFDQFDQAFHYGISKDDGFYVGTAKDGVRRDYLGNRQVKISEKTLRKTYFDKYQLLEYYHSVWSPDYGLLDMDGNVVVPVLYPEIAVPFADRYILYTGSVDAWNETQAQLFAEDGTLLAEGANRYDYLVLEDGSYIGFAYQYSEEALPFKHVTQWFIDKDGRPIDDNRYEQLYFFDHMHLSDEAVTQDNFRGLDWGSYGAYVQEILYPDTAFFCGVTADGTEEIIPLQDILLPAS